MDQLYKGLSVLADESDKIEAAVYQHSLDVVPRNTKILYYDCTNFYFEIEQEDGIRRYGRSKENRPNPIVQMGMFMDGSGMPLAFTLNAGNTNEQTTLKPRIREALKSKLRHMLFCIHQSNSPREILKKQIAPFQF